MFRGIYDGQFIPYIGVQISFFVQRACLYSIGCRISYEKLHIKSCKMINLCPREVHESHDHGKTYMCIYMQGEPVELMQCLFSSVLCVQGKAVGRFGPHLYSHVSIIRAFTAA